MREGQGGDRTREGNRGQRGHGQDTYLFLVKRGGGVTAGEGVREYLFLFPPRCLSLDLDLDLERDLERDLEWERDERESRRCFLRDRRCCCGEWEWLRLALLDRLPLLPLRFLPEFLGGGRVEGREGVLG